ncbi:unnamed protein product [Cyprideis torosa]|uniref:Uncharacterized protein n=1 Tax=Cyprideis torosa TaxID=163714 RepID=A0A7R8WBM4_9CRUS|nr:unnamed protein product [Cyprideis torosa]CAG0892418.1 unnamed protein product [Cyprideis torosa]
MAQSPHTAAPLPGSVSVRTGRPSDCECPHTAAPLPGSVSVRTGRPFCECPHTAAPLPESVSVRTGRPSDCECPHTAAPLPESVSVRTGRPSDCECPHTAAPLPGSVSVRTGRPSDCEAIVSLIRGLAEYERMGNHCHINTQVLLRDGFEAGAQPWFYSIVATRRTAVPTTQQGVQDAGTSEELIG